MSENECIEIGESKGQVLEETENMNKVLQKLTENQIKSLPLILGAGSITQGCEQANISRTTFYAWLENDDFRNEFFKKRREVFNFAIEELKSSVNEAVSVLRGLLNAPSDRVKLRASEAILENAIRLMEIENLLGRLERLEMVLK